MKIYLNSILGETLNTRDEAAMLISSIIPNSNEEIIFDFSDVIFMSRSFADEFYIEYKKIEKMNNKVVFNNANIQIIDIIKAIDNTYNKTVRSTYIEYPKFSFTNYNQLNNYLQAL